MDAILQAAALGAWELFRPLPMLALVTGSLVGIASGALPGASIPGLIVLIGIAWGMDPTIAIPMAVGMMATVHTSDTLPSVILGIPGSSSSQATIMDGYPMSQQGRAGEALAAGYLASMIGGFVAVGALILIVPVARAVIGSFGAPELLTITVLGICMVGVLSSGAIVKGLIGAVIGLAISMIGLDRAGGQERYTFGSLYLLDGVGFILVVIGIFAIPELVGLIIGERSISKYSPTQLGEMLQRGRRKGMVAVIQNKWLVFRSSLLGVIAGITPGVGQATVDWFTYVQARLTVKGGTKTFGTGDVRGVIAPESANNATAAATFIPAMAVGIPVGYGSALVIGLLITLGVPPGPRLLASHLDLIFLVIFSLIISNTIGTLLMLGLSPFVARVTFIRPRLLVPVVLAVLVTAAFQVRHSMWDLVVLALVAVLGWHMKRYGWARPPVIIGVILGPLIELYYIQTVRAYDPIQIVQRPIIWGIVAVAGLVVIASLRMRVGARQLAGTPETPAVPTGAADSPENPDVFDRSGTDDQVARQDSAAYGDEASNSADGPEEADGSR